MSAGIEEGHQQESDRTEHRARDQKRAPTQASNCHVATGGREGSAEADEQKEKVRRRARTDAESIALRHQAVTQALTVTGGDLYRVQKFSRLQSFAMVKRYDDARVDDAGTVAKLVAAEE
jgi:hypothetical protein